VGSLFPSSEQGREDVRRAARMKEEKTEVANNQAGSFHHIIGGFSQNIVYIIKICYLCPHIPQVWLVAPIDLF
jgi:hypothetical protein